MQVVFICEDLGYVGCVTPSDAVSKKQLRWLIETHILMEFVSMDAWKDIYGK